MVTKKTSAKNQLARLVLKWKEIKLRLPTCQEGTKLLITLGMCTQHNGTSAPTIYSRHSGQKLLAHGVTVTFYKILFPKVIRLSGRPKGWQLPFPTYYYRCLQRGNAASISSALPGNSVSFYAIHKRKLKRISINNILKDIYIIIQISNLIQ